jgi:ParB-like chromosome segregation protein Spo0J
MQVTVKVARRVGAVNGEEVVAPKKPGGRKAVRRKRRKFEVEIVKLADLKPHPRNYVEHPDDQVEHIAQSIRQHGIYRNVIIARDGTILAGHGVVMAAKKEGITKLPVVRLNVKSDSPAALKVLTGDNELRHLAEINDRELADLLKEIKDSDEAGLLGTGYDEMMLANLVLITRAEEEIEDIDAAAAWVGMPEYEPGEGFKQIIIRFRNEADRDKFMEKFKKEFSFTRHSNAYSAWWPPKERQDFKAVRFKG